MKIRIKLLLILEIVLFLSACNLMFWEEEPYKIPEEKVVYYTLSVDLGEYELDSLSTYDSTKLYKSDWPEKFLDTSIIALDDRWDGSKTDMTYRFRVWPIPPSNFNKLLISLISGTVTIDIDTNGYASVNSNEFRNILGATSGRMIISHNGPTNWLPASVEIDYKTINLLPEGSVSENDTIEHTWGLHGGFDSSLNE